MANREYHPLASMRGPERKGSVLSSSASGRLASCWKTRIRPPSVGQMSGIWCGGGGSPAFHTGMEAPAGRKMSLLSGHDSHTGAPPSPPRFSAMKLFQEKASKSHWSPSMSSNEPLGKRGWLGIGAPRWIATWAVPHVTKTLSAVISTCACRGSSPLPAPGSSAPPVRQAAMVSRTTRAARTGAADRTPEGVRIVRRGWREGTARRHPPGPCGGRARGGSTGANYGVRARHCQDTRTRTYLFFPVHTYLCTLGTA